MRMVQHESEWSEWSFELLPSKFKTALDKFNNDPVNIESGVAPMREIEGDLTSKLVTFK